MAQPGQRPTLSCEMDEPNRSDGIKKNKQVKLVIISEVMISLGFFLFLP